MLAIELEDLAQVGLTSTTQYKRAGALLTRRTARCTRRRKLFTLETYRACWFEKDRKARYALADGVGLRICHDGHLTPWKTWTECQRGPPEE